MSRLTKLESGIKSIARTPVARRHSIGFSAVGFSFPHNPLASTTMAAPKSEPAAQSRKKRAVPSVEIIIRRLKALGSAKDRAGMARFGIETSKAFGVSVVVLRDIAKEIGTDHTLAAKLWKRGYHEARLLAGFIDDPRSVTEHQMERWAKDFDSWDLCDQCCGFLFDKTPYARKKAMVWSRRQEEFVKRAGFVLMAALAVHDKKADDSLFISFLPRIEMESIDERNFVRKAVNWSLRQIGKRNRTLNAMAIATAKKIAVRPSKAARWIAADALRELTSGKVQRRLA